MTLEEINERIEVLEQMKEDMNNIVHATRTDIALKEVELVGLHDIVARNTFDNREESQELKELKIARKWLER